MVLEFEFQNRYFTKTIFPSLMKYFFTGITILLFLLNFQYSQLANQNTTLLRNTNYEFNFEL